MPCMIAMSFLVQCLVMVMWVIAGSDTGVYGQGQLRFRGVSYPNNSVLLLNDIGELTNGSAIICITNRSPCCSTPPNRFGFWYYPNGSVVPNNAAGEDFSRGRGDNQIIWLSRRNNSQSPTGSFCCELPDNNDVTHRFCVNLVTVPVQLIFRGVSYPNNSVLSLNDIRELTTGSAILCTTNRSPCCQNPNRGEWYYPNGSVVPNNAAGEDFFRGRGDNQTIWLSRRNNGQSPTGSFCCELPDNSEVNHRVCVYLDINECADRAADCVDDATCVNTDGSFTCTCPSGFTGDGRDSGSGCIDINECTSRTDDCVDNVTCVNTDGSFTCTCPSGFTGDGRDSGSGCIDINECTNGTDDCVVDTTCVNTDGSFTCTCPPGFTGDGRDTGSGCRDIDECTEDPDNCEDGYNCLNTLGSFLCNDINECTSGTHDCVEGACVNTLGSFTCTCPSGFTGDGRESGSGCTAPVITAMVSGGTPTVRESYSLTCTVTGADRLNPTITYQWFKDNTVVSDETQSTLSFSSLSLSDAGQYRCDITVRSNSLSQSISSQSDRYELIMTSQIFQLRLRGIPSCLEWISKDTLRKSNELIAILVQEVEQACECGFTRDHITEDAFQCFSESPQHVTFRARLTELRATQAQATSLALITYIEEWASISQTIAIQRIRLLINNTCNVLIEDFDSPECLLPVTTDAEETVTTSTTLAPPTITFTVPAPGSSGSLSTGVVIGIIFGAILVVLIVSIAVVVVVIVVVQVPRKKSKPSTKTQMELPPLPKKRDDSNNPSYDVVGDTNQDGHEYECVSRVVKPSTVASSELYEEIGQQVTDYTQCPAYAPTTITTRAAADDDKRPERRRVTHNEGEPEKVKTQQEEGAYEM